MTLDDLKKEIQIHSDGYKFVAIFALITILLFMINEEIGFLGLTLTAWCYYFFRNPERLIPSDKNLIVSPADGKVVIVKKVTPPKEYGLEGDRWRISVFLNVFDVHVNRLSVGGTVKGVHYHKGQFLNASFDKASDLNERNTVVIDMENNKDIAITQIAGLVARRIRCDIKKGDVVSKGDVYGLIRFGSRADIFLPMGATPNVIVGQRMISGESVLSNLKYEQENLKYEEESEKDLKNKA